MLRFKNDDGSEFPEWEEKKIGELGTFIKGAALSKADISESGSPLILYGELYTTYKEVAYNIQRKTQAVVDKKYYSCVGDVIIPTSGESAEEISTATCVMVPDVILGGDLNIFRSDIVDGRIMSYILNHQAKWKIATIAQGKSIVHIQAKQLANICVKYPLSKVEQQKIAEFLLTIDTVIEKQKETVSVWEERKKGVMQKLFSQEVRFKADDESEFPEWEEKKIDDVATCFAGATPSTKIPEYWEDGTIRWMSSGEVNNGQIHDTEKRISQLGFDKCSTKMVKPNTVVMALAGQGKTRGMVAITRVPLCTNQSLCAIETNDDICDDYLYQYLQTQYNNLRLISSGDGTRGGLNLKLVGGYIVSVPCLEEQQKIADCLSSFDEVIEKQKATLAAWEELKKGLLQQMFV